MRWSSFRKDCRARQQAASEHGPQPRCPEYPWMLPNSSFDPSCGSSARKASSGATELTPRLTLRL
ncbi:hypothetical protein Taro_014533 [Colocasia esculenta]|uniref:Uncharacterized protein n=1 Tax=Colocasia esculenta TaxID=4460 RepID=A0A843UF01_COLES|nr:hypothetical protein [Colocasia esculenta]